MGDIADIPTISLSKLLASQDSEDARLFDICCSHGFFYLDYTDHETWPAAAVKSLFTLGEEFFALPEDDKMKISMESAGTYFG
jgi:isopenicillin N synthase-like dioxygenase